VILQRRFRVTVEERAMRPQLPEKATIDSLCRSQIFHSPRPHPRVQVLLKNHRWQTMSSLIWSKSAKFGTVVSGLAGASCAVELTMEDHDRKSRTVRV
jgi:hypothetical protein